MLGAIARKYDVPVIYVNQAGGSDELVFDGRTCAFAAGGELVARAAAFAPDVLVVDLERLWPASGRVPDPPPTQPASAPVPPPTAVSADDFTPASEVWRALVAGPRDYAAKRFRRALLGLSGGIDSALVAAVAAEALGPGNVLGVLLPSPYSSKGSVTDAQALADALAIRTETLPIADVMGAFERALSPVFAGRAPDVTEENIQARIRGNVLMALSNKFDSLLLTTGNKSELAVGYCTIYGDMSGGLAVISDVPKTMVYEVARWLNDDRGRGHPQGDPRQGALGRTAARPDRPGQPAALRRARRHPRTAHRGTPRVEEIVAQGYEQPTVERVVRLVSATEFKRKQAAPGIKVTDRAFGIGWRMPIATVPRSRRRPHGDLIVGSPWANSPGPSFS